MIKAIVTDFSKVLLFPKDRSYTGSLNSLHREQSKKTDYTFFDTFELNKELLKYYDSLKSRYSCYIFTSEDIQKAPELQTFIKPVFKNVFSAKDMNVNKKDEAAYKKLASEIGLNPAEIIYIDDSELNIHAANKVGFQTILFMDIENLKEAMKRII